MNRSWLAVIATVTALAFAACGGQAAQEEIPVTEEAAPPVEMAPEPEEPAMEEATEDTVAEPEAEAEEDTESEAEPPTEG